MFHESMPFTAVVVVAALLASRRPESINLIGVLLALGAAMLGGPVTLGVFLLLFLALLAWPFIRHRVRTFLPLAVLAVVIPYAVIARKGVQEQVKYERLRKEYPVESLAGRVPEARAELHTPLTVGATVKLDKFEEAVGDEIRRSRRSWTLRMLHERNVKIFANAPDFGARRVIRIEVNDETLKDDSGRDPTPSQPGSPAVWGHGEPFEPGAPQDRDKLSGLHSASVLDFVNPPGWGYVNGRDRVAGFLSHRFSKVPEAEVWQVQRIELVGLLKHPEPVVYLSDRLPAMSELRDTPTRPIDAFETDGLKTITTGEEGFAARRGDVIRYLGAIRTAKQCIECHGGERGDLLGAFTYTLRAKQ